MASDVAFAMSMTVTEIQHVDIDVGDGRAYALTAYTVS